MLTDHERHRIQTRVTDAAVCPFCQRVGLGTEWITITDQRAGKGKLTQVDDILVVTCECGFHGSRLVT